MASEVAFKTFLSLVKPLKNKGLGNIRFVNNAYRWAEGMLLPHSSRLVTVNGLKMQLVAKSIDGIERQLIYNHEYEPVTTSILKKVVRPGMTSVDVGANIGYFTLLLSGLVGENGRVWSFEPEEQNFTMLLNNIRLNDLNNIITLQQALSNKVTTCNLYVSGEESGEHGLILRRHCKKVQSVTTTTLDRVVTQYVDVVKTDTEGNDFNVLLGAKRLFGRRPLFVTEFWPDGIMASGTSPKIFWDYLKSMYKWIYLVDEIEKSISVAVYENALTRCRRNMMSVNLVCSKEALNVLE